MGGVQGNVTSTLNNGAIYDTLSNTWTAIPTPPTAVYNYSGRSMSESAISTGSKFISWHGGTVGRALYDVTTNQWYQMSGVGEPALRYEHGSVWTGSSMIVWGGMSLSNGAYLNSGGIYTPAMDPGIP